MDAHAAAYSSSARPVRIAVLASGAGSNFRVLLRHSLEDDLGGGQIVCLLSDKPLSGAALHAAATDLPYYAETHKAHGGRAGWEQAALQFLQSQRVDFIVLAGYMRLIGGTLLTPYEGRMINIHPSLLPAFPGLDAPAQALAARAAETGVTVHYVDAGLDTGEVIAQRVVAIHEFDTLESLTARIHSAEHELYPSVVSAICASKMGRKQDIKEQ